MENAAEALKMAAAVLIFVLALSIAINSFSEARIASQKILDSRDREYDYSYVKNNGGTERLVGAESIVPTIYKAYKENYKIVFDGVFRDGIYKKKNENGEFTPIHSIDLQKEVLGNDTQKEQFIMSLLYGKKYKEFATLKPIFEKNLKIVLNEDGLYDKINDIGKLKESIGIYYLEEDGAQEEDNSNVPDINKTEKRVITYSKP